MLQDSTFKVLLDNLHEGVYFVDCQRQIEYWNKGAERISGFAPSEVVGKRCLDNILVHVDENGRSLCQGACPLAATIQDGQERHARVFMRHKAGYRVPVHVTVAPIHNEDGRIIGALEAFHDDTPIIAAMQQLADLKEKAHICPLTGAANRRGVEELLSRRIAEFRQNQNCLALMFIDVDHFKDVNDQFGHTAGDAALRMVSQTLTKAIRSYDCLGRWGGEEFILVMPSASPEHLETIANRFRILVESSSVELEERHLHVTVSIGACMARPDDTAASLVARADSLMYTSKRNGRNRVSVDLA